MGQRVKLVVIGASGCIGKNLVSFFSSSQYEIVPVSRTDCDLSKKGASTKLAQSWDARSVVIPLAFLTRWRAASSEVEREAFSDINHRITENISEALCLHPPAHCVYVSTSGVYGLDGDKHYADEREPRQATDSYGMAKIAAEDTLMRTALDRFPLTVLRLTIAYGCGNELTPYQPHGMAKQAMEGKTIYLWGDGSEIRDFIHHSDLMRSIKSVISNRFNGVLNVGSGHPTSYSEITQIIRNYLPEVKIAHRERTRTKVDLTYDNSQLLGLIGEHEPFTKTEEFLNSFLTG